MSNYVLPDLPGRVHEPEREAFFSTEVQEAPSGAEQRLSRYIKAGRRRYRLRWSPLRDDVAAPAPWNAYSELQIMVLFHEWHRGAGDSFLMSDPIAGRNLLAYSQDLSQAAWSKNTGVTVVADSVVAPDGTTTADSLVYAGTGAAGDWRLLQTGDNPSLSGQSYAAGAWLRAASALSVRLGTNLGSVVCALTTSWQHFEATGVGNGTTLADLLIQSAAADNAAWTIYAWGLQLVRASSSGLYVPTGASPVTGQVRVRFAEDGFAVRKAAEGVYEAEAEFVTVDA